MNFHRPKGSKGKYSCDRKTRHFWRWYYKTITNPIPYSKGKNLYNKLLNSLALMSIEKGEYFLIPNLGFFCACKIPKKITDDNGKLRMSNIGVDWKATKEHWKNIYPDKTIEDIKNTTDRPYIYHKNKTKLGSILKFSWVRSKAIKKYTFKSLTCIDSALGQKAKMGAIGNPTREDFQLLINTFKRKFRK